MGFGFGLAFGVMSGAIMFLLVVYQAYKNEIDAVDTELETHLMTPSLWLDIDEPIESIAPETPQSAAGTSQ